jgi:branched-chain amino acid transport system ATP-binding protein
VRENLLLGGYRRARGVEEDMAALQERFPILASRRHQLAGTLSGGEQQMLALARALLGRPRVLLLDEPSLGLAPMVVAEMFRIIREIHAAGTTILLVEQNARGALAIADYGYVLESGRIVLEGTSARLQADPNVAELYLGVVQEASVKGFRRYRIRRRWA